MPLPTLAEAQEEGYRLLVYYRGIGVPEKKAMRIASEYMMRRFLFRQDAILDAINE